MSEVQAWVTVQRLLAEIKKVIRKKRKNKQEQSLDLKGTNKDNKKKKKINRVEQYRNTL